MSFAGVDIFSSICYTYFCVVRIPVFGIFQGMTWPFAGGVLYSLIEMSFPFHT